MYGLKCTAKTFLHWFFTVKKTFVIFRNRFHCRYNELVIFVIVYCLLHCPPHSVFLCVCNVNFEEILLYSMMISPYLVPLVTTIQVIEDKYNSEVNYSGCNETPVNETGQLICKAFNWLVSIWNEFVLKVISQQTIV